MSNLTRDDVCEALKEYYTTNKHEANLMFWPHSDLALFSNPDGTVSVEESETQCGDEFQMFGCRCIVYPGKKLLLGRNSKWKPED